MRIKQVTFYIIFLFACINTIHAQLISTNNTAINELVSDLKGDDCIQVSNVSISQSGTVDNIVSFGGFQNSSSGFPFTNGIILSTGAISSSGNSSISNNLNEGSENWLGDTNLETILGVSNSLNATVLEFDVTAMGDELSFEYLIASEEYYNENPCNHSDYFAALIKPADNSAAYANMALIPTSNDIAGTGNIHPQIIGFCNAQNENFFAGYNLGNTNFNGRTTAITASTSIIPNVTYHVKLVIADQGDSALDTAVFLKQGSLSTRIDLGEDVNTCAPTYTINSPIEFTNATYQWSLNGSLLPETSSELTATTSGIYTLEISSSSFGSCMLEGTVNISLNENLPTETVADFTKCDDYIADGFTSFDLSTKDNELINAMNTSGATYTVTYFLTENEASNNINAIDDVFTNTSNPQTIYARIANNATGCKAVNEFNLIVNTPSNSITEAPSLTKCDYDSDGFITFSFTSTKQFYQNQYPNAQVQLFATIENAQNGISALANNYQNTSNPQTLYIRVITNTGACPMYSTVDLLVNTATPLLQSTTSLNACEENTSFTSFDLTTALDNLVSDPNNPNYTTSYYLSNNNAINGTNPINTPENFTNTQENQQTVYVKIVDETNTSGCFSIASITLYTDELSTNANDHYYACDDSSNDGIAIFDLEDVANSVVNNNNDYSVQFYLIENDPSSILDNNTPFENTSNPQTIYANINSSDCSSNIAVTLEVSPFFTIEAPTEPFDYCDSDQNLSTTVFFGDFDEYFLDGNDYTIKYYHNYENAVNENASFLYSYYSNVDYVFYARVTDNITGCYDIVPFSVNILPAPVTYTPNDIYYCDDNNDGIYTFDLTTVIPEVVSSTENRTFEFYLAVSDATNGINEISTPETYTSETDQIIIKIINSETGCYQLQSFNINVISFDEDAEISNINICETDSNGTEPIIFEEKDEEISNGQSAVVVSYYETEENAINNENSIDKTTEFNAVNQTIYARAQNSFDPACYYIYSFEVEINEEPTFTMPNENYNLCDDVSGDGFETFDLNTIYEEVIASANQNITFNFYLSEEAASLEEDPLSLTYTNIENPQIIYGKVKSQNGCEVLFPLQLNVIQVAEFEVPQPYVFCDIDYDGIMTFDLTAEDFGALPERLDNLDINYYHSQNDAELDQNSFENADAYTVENHDIIYISITNTVSGCNIIYPVEITVNTPPEVLISEPINICENQDALIYLSDYNSQIFNDTEAFTISYYQTEAEADAQINAVEDAFTYSESNFILFVYAENSTTGCFTIESIAYQINPLPEVNEVADFSVCSNTGFYNQDLSEFGNLAFENSNNEIFNISYFHSEDDALDNSNAITNWNTYPLQNEEEIFIRVTNTTTGCFAYTSFTSFLIVSPEIPIYEDFVICSENSPLTVDASTGTVTDTYLWSTNETTSAIDITEPGVYSVTVTNEIGCTSTKYFGVSASEPATILDIETTGFSENNTITVSISGSGNYMFSLDGGTPQSSNTFTNVLMGSHVVSVIDTNGCQTTLSDAVVIFGFPTYFTPNGDGTNDRWNVFGFDSFSDSEIYIFNRYGKLLKVLKPGDYGWDGNYNGASLPPSDYWFKAIIKNGDESFEQTGHFSLKR
ncbi:gliding motility-associated C-terminal domain-containing protein [Pustulibacterium marinum]|uniref:Gliding motility-associated C-terminal domain-containing protein n=1 Tax=Pustulibacterium marinum TaxID=1224947 RepID=A0A1I7FLM8_9FLAO|nr:T9SS type B sorting domain-containing protein [Pustulibacterium marinum]SFU37080.1 gliding motility-associated C-terminal domain-containing protein [Pustulibacterium marinum]